MARVDLGMTGIKSTIAAPVIRRVVRPKNVMIAEGIAAGPAVR